MTIGLARHHGPHAGPALLCQPLNVLRAQVRMIAGGNDPRRTGSQSVRGNQRRSGTGKAWRIGQPWHSRKRRRQFARAQHNSLRAKRGITQNPQRRRGNLPQRAPAKLQQLLWPSHARAAPPDK